jgi:hypothetical protein
MTAFERVSSALRSKHASLSHFFALSLPARRHIGLYTRGIVPFTRLSPALLIDEA